MHRRWLTLEDVRRGYDRHAVEDATGTQERDQRRVKARLRLRADGASLLQNTTYGPSQHWHLLSLELCPSYAFTGHAREKRFSISSTLKTVAKLSWLHNDRHTLPQPYKLLSSNRDS